MLRPLLALTLALTVPQTLGAQLQSIPRTSPSASVLQTFGATELRVDYHRPSVRGRVIWGGLVPYDAAWRAGANETTTFQTSTDIQVEGQPLAAGTYGLHVLPTTKEWTVIFSKRTQGFGQHDPSQDALTVQVTPIEAERTESMVYGFRDLSNLGATFTLRWDALEVPVRITADTPNIVVRKLEAELLSAGSAQNYVQAANYCLANGVSLEKALGWVERSLAEGESFFGLVVKGGLLDRLGNTVDADPLIERALAMSPRPRQLSIFGQQFQDSDQHALALRFLFPLVDQDPTSSANWEAVANCFVALGMADEAAEAYASALENTQNPADLARLREASARVETLRKDG